MPHQQLPRLGLGEHRVVILGTKVRVDDGHHLAAGARELLLHAHRVREEVLVPCEVALAWLG